MKIKIIDLLNKIANNEEVPKIIIYKNKRYGYYSKDKDYYLDADYDEALFDSYVITDILNDEVEILKINLNTKDMNLSYAVLNNPTENELVLLHKINEIIEAIDERQN